MKSLPTLRLSSQTNGAATQNRTTLSGKIPTRIVTKNEQEIREHEHKEEDIERMGDEILAKFEGILKRSKVIAEKKANLLQDIESGLNLTLHNVVHEY